VRPGDLVGAIANESELTGGDIGPIKVGETFSTVDVPSADADAVIAAIKRTTIRGRRAQIRRDREQR
jgi:ATP-dependent RNA helicase DeaD